MADEAKCIDHIRSGNAWSTYTMQLIDEAVAVARRRQCLRKLHVLLYPSNLLPEHVERLQQHGKAVVWLKDAKSEASVQEEPG